MSDYREQTARPSTGDIGTPALFVRNDAGGDISGANLQRVVGQVGSDGAVKFNGEGMKATYSVSQLDLALAATPTDAFTLSGSASKTVKITRVEIAFSDTTGATTIADVQLVIRTTANSGGTSTAPTPTKHDSNDGAATAVAAAYTANPASLGTSAGVVRAQKLALQTPAVGVAATDSVIWDFGTRPGAKELTLRGAAQFLAINFNSSAVGTGPTASITIEFTEEPNTV